MLEERPGSVVQGGDEDCLKLMLELHAPPRGRLARTLSVLDVTYGQGRMWGTLEPTLKLTSNDRNPRSPADHHYDFRQLPSSWSSSFDVVVFDPPHLAEAGRSSTFGERFGNDHADVQHVPNINHLFRPFLAEAARVLKRNGIVIAKLVDQVHRGRRQWQIFYYLQAVFETPELVPCDEFIKYEQRAQRITGHNWQRIRHSRRAHTQFIVSRKGRC